MAMRFRDRSFDIIVPEDKYEIGCHQNYIAEGVSLNKNKD